MQSCEMPASAFDLFAERDRAARLGKVHHQHLAGDRVLVKEFFTGTTDRQLHEQMDARRAQLEAAGAASFYRTKIGRNATCPCGSGRKFKKCCIDKAQQAT
jgi:uncharacterized protein YecA (UPF0149 family)